MVMQPNALFCTRVGVVGAEVDVVIWCTSIAGQHIAAGPDVRTLRANHAGIYSRTAEVATGRE